MKKLTFLLLFLYLLVSSLGAQQLTASSGDEATLGETQISWSIGEPFVHTLWSGTMVLTEGLQQPWIGSEELAPAQNYSWSVHPNPASDYLIFKMLRSPPQEEMWAAIFDMLGRPILKRKVALHKDQFIFDIRGVPPGAYGLHLQSKTSHLRHTQPIIIR